MRAFIRAGLFVSVSLRETSASQATGSSLASGNIHRSNLESRSALNAIDARIRDRAIAVQGQGVVHVHPGEDPLGDWFDRVSRGDLSELLEVIRSGLLYLVPPLLGLPPSSQAL